MTESRDKYLFNFIKKYQIVFQSGCRFTIPPAIYEGFSFAISPPLFGIVSLFLIVGLQVGIK